MTKFVQWPLIADSIRSMQQRSIARRRCTKRHTTLAGRNASRLEMTTGMGWNGIPRESRGTGNKTPTLEWECTNPRSTQRQYPGNKNTGNQWQRPYN